MDRHEFSYARDDTPLTLIRRLRYLKPTYEPRQQWFYNNQVRAQLRRDVFAQQAE